jgi:hypothetical protein
MANRVAMARPIPLAAPVTAARLPSNRKFSIVSSQSPLAGSANSLIHLEIRLNEFTF